MDRRALLKNGSMAMLGMGLSACASKPPPAVAPTPRRRRVHLVPAQISWDRIIRTTVGLRPHRPSGFVLKVEKIDDKLVVHNYGHGGSGMSLSWGTGQMAAELALEHVGRRAAVLGCGMVGLTCTRQLQRRGFDVTIYAMAVPPHTTSNMSLAGWTPTSGLVNFRTRTPEWEAQFQQAATIAYREHQLLAGSHYGVSWINSYTPTDDARMATGTNILLPDALQGAKLLLQPGEHPFPKKYALQISMMRFEPSIYLNALVKDVQLYGARIVIRKFDAVRDLMSLTEPVVVNCTGLGAKDLFGDEELVPLKGQLTAITPQPDVNYGTTGGVHISTGAPGIGIHMMPRSDGLILGGTSERGEWSLDVNEEERRRIVEGHIELFDAMRAMASGRAT